MSKREQRRIIELQEQVRIARRALERILYTRDPELADEALYEMMRLDEKYQMQGLLGHATKKELGQ